MEDVTILTMHKLQALSEGLFETSFGTLFQISKTFWAGLRIELGFMYILHTL
jgi:hypothetical protein